MKSSIVRGSSLNYLTVFPDGYVEGNRYPLVFLLHGFGASKDDLGGLAPLIDRTGYLYILPDAPLGIADDPSMRTWYERGGKVSPEAVREALTALDGLVREVRDRFRVQPGCSLLAGFSQGGAMSLRYGLPRPDFFAGIAILSGSLRQLEDLKADLPSERKQAIFVAHGWRDAMVPFEWSRDLVEFLEKHDYRPTYKTYSIDHEISPAELSDLRGWFKKVLPPGLRHCEPN